jgi:hypothetical protein
MMMSPPPSKSSARSGNTAAIAGAKTTSQLAGTSKPSKKRYIPRQYPKPTLAELALLVGDIKPSMVTAVQKPLPYELKWRENGAELSLHAANQGFIATQMARLQTHTVTPLQQPLRATTTTQGVLAESSVALVSGTEVAGAVENLLQYEDAYASHAPIAVTNQLAALLALPVLDEETPVSEQKVNACEIEQDAETLAFAESIELEFATPVESGLAEYLGVTHSSTITISVEHQRVKPTAGFTPPPATTTPLLSNDEYFSQALEAELAAQKVWLAEALAREQQKAYPHKRLNALPTPQACVEEQQALVNVVHETMNFDTEEEAVPLPLQAIHEPLMTLDGTIDTNSKDENEQDFAAVLESLMEDFSATAPEEEAITSDAVVVEEEPQAAGIIATEEVLFEDTIPLSALETINATNNSDNNSGEAFEVVGVQAPHILPVDTVDALETEAQEQLNTEWATEPDAVVEDPTPPTFTQLLKRAKSETPLELLLLGAWFLKEHEAQTTFSLRKLNHLLSSVSKPNANHTVLEVAISKHYVTLIPDLTGKATATEYQLSRAGENAAIKLAQVLQ